MRRVAVLVVVAAGLLVTLLVSGTDVLPSLSTDGEKPTKSTVRTSTPSPSPSPTVADTDAVYPGTVLTARPQPRRCPNPPCIPVG